MSAPNVASGCGVGPGGFDVQNAGGTLFTRPIQRCWAEKKMGVWHVNFVRRVWNM